MKFKGQIIKSPKREYSLRQQLGQGGFSVILSTSDTQTICKIQVLSNPEISLAYQSQKKSLSLLSHKNIIHLKQSFQIKQKDDQYGFLMLENCNKGNVYDILESYGEQNVPEKIVIKVFYYVASAITYMHSKSIIHRDIKMENVLQNSKGQFKVCDFGSSSNQIITKVDKSNRADIQQNIQKTTTPFYRSPQQLDLYSGFEIGPKVDIFAMGVLIFMLCFKKPPFQSRLSAINKQYFIPQQTSYSSELIQLIQKCFTTNPNDRCCASELKSQIKLLSQRKVGQIELNLQKQYYQTHAQIAKINSNMLKKNTIIAQTSIFDKIKKLYNQITTETQGWIASFVQDNQEAPHLKYNRSLLAKCWEKRYKCEKMYELMFKYAQDYKNKSLVNVKLLILLHNFLRKGPSQSINYDGKFASPKLCQKIYRNWKISQQPSDSEDIKRNSYLCLIIRYYSLIILQKWKLCYQHSSLIQGNFSILPFLKTTTPIALLKLPFIQVLIKFLQNLMHSYLVDIQRSIILSLVDEEYCCFSLVVFLIVAFKQALTFVHREELDFEALESRINKLQKHFQYVFNKLIKLFQSANKLASLFDQDKQFALNPNILDYIKAINIKQKKSGNFQFNKYINYKVNILGLKIPLSYQEAVKNPNFLKSLQKKDETNVVQVNQFKVKKLTEKIKTQPYPTQKKDNLNVFPAGLNDSKDPNDAFKKNKQHKVYENQQAELVKKVQQKSEVSRNLVKQDLLMQFTHQNFNKDMNVSQNQSPISTSILPSNQVNENIIYQNNQNFQKNNQFKDFLTIVDDKNKNLNGNQFFQSTDSKISEVKKSNDFFNNFHTIVGTQYSKISSVNSNGQRKNEVMPVVTNGNNKFQIFNSIGLNENKQFAKNQSPKKQSPKRQLLQNQLSATKQISPKKQLNSINIQKDSILQSSISSASKQVYDSLNSYNKQQQNVQLLNFFQDQQPSQSNQQISSQPKSNNPLHFNTISKPNLINIQQKVQMPQRQFKTGPIQDYSFIDLKGFIVQEVKKNAEQYFIQFNNLKFFAKVGFGHSSEVFKGEWRGRQVAIKRIKDNMSPSNAKQFKRQIMTSVKIRHHPNLVTLIGIAQYQNQYYIINEFCNGATLFDFLHQSNHLITIQVKISIARQIAKGMLFLHTNDPPIIHRDLKSLNVLLVNKYNNQLQPQIKIADFGLSRDFASTYMTGTLGTYHWMAPEIFNNQTYTLKADVYSYGIVLWEILSRMPPYTNIKNPHSLMKFITLENGRPDLTMIASDCPYQLRMLMISCWDRYPENRPDFQQILATLNQISPQ